MTEKQLKMLLQINAMLRARTANNDWFVLPGQEITGQELSLIVTHLDYENQSAHDIWDVALIVCKIVNDMFRDAGVDDSNKIGYEVKSSHIVIADLNTFC